MSLADARPVLAYIPSPPQGVWNLGPIPLRAYAIAIIVGIVVAIMIAERRMVARGGQAGTILDIAIWAVPFGLVGGRLYHVTTDYWRYFGAGKHPLDALKIWDGGLGIPGAIALGALGAWIACRRKGIPLPFAADAIAPGVAVAQGIGRIGNYFNEELFGGPTNLPWGLEIYNRVTANGQVDYLNGVKVPGSTPVQIVHPTFLYELVWDLLIALLVVLVDRRLRLGHGRAFALYVASYAFGRFWIELMRSDDATRIFGIRVNVWTMSLLFVAAVVYFVLAGRRGPREDPATFPGYAHLPAAAGEPGAGADQESGSEPPAVPDDEAAHSVAGPAEGGAGA